MRYTVLAATILVLSAGIGAALEQPQTDRPDRSRLQTQPVPATFFAQAMSPRCSTPEGVCLVAPRPIGSPCSCGGVAGTIIP